MIAETLTVYCIIFLVCPRKTQEFDTYEKADTLKYIYNEQRYQGWLKFYVLYK